MHFDVGIKPGQGEHGREDIDEAHLRVDANAVQLVDRAGDDEGNVERVIVHEETVGPLAVTAQPLAMIADDDNDRLLIEAGRPKPGEHSTDLLIRKGDLAVIQTGEPTTPEVGTKRLGRLVRAVRVIQVDPGEKRCIPAGVEPMKRRVDHLIRGPLNRGQVDVLELLQVELVVVDAKPLIQTPAAIENERADERAGLVPTLRERFGQRRLGLAEGRGAVQAYAVIRRVETRHD